MSVEAGLDRGVFTISLDFELIWGTMDKAGVARFAPACMLEREVVIDRLLDLFCRFEISATWCVLGHLFLDRCEPAGGRKHPEIVRPSHSWFPGDWFTNDPCTTEAADPIFYGRSVVNKIRSARVRQEIGSHSFSHVIFGDPGCSAEAADSELKACVQAATALGMTLRSFAFPRNSVGHRERLRANGFTVYRGPEPTPYRGLPRVLARAMNLVDVVRAAEPPVVLPRKDELDLWDIPGSMIYFPMHGIRGAVPVSRRVRRAIKGLDAAAKGKRIFHLWFHPTNLADQTDRMFEGLEAILEHAASLRSRDRLEVASMSAVIDKLDQRAGADA